VATAAAPGVTTVTVKGAHSGVEATATISVPTPVEEPEVINVTLTPTAATLIVGQTLTLNAASTDAADTTFGWVSGNTTAATLDGATGAASLLTAVAPGLATVTVTGGHSGAAANATISILASEEEIENIPLVSAGLKINILEVTIPADLKPVVTFTATNDRGDVIPKRELSSVRFLLTRLETAPAAGNTARFLSYINNAAGQATYDGNNQSTGLTANSDGTYTFKFKSALPAGYEMAATHAVGGQFSRTSVLDGVAYPANATYEFRPDGGVVTATRDIVDTATCNECHTRLGFHGGGRREVKLCILCHNTGTTDPDTGNTVDMPVMIHKIHMGEALPSVEGGTPYQIIGYQNSVHDYSEVVFPQDIRNCATCHVEDGKASQAGVYLTKPSRAGCGSCHDRVWFGDPGATPAGFENHPMNFSSDNDGQCATCHTPQAPGIAPIHEAHLTLTQRPEAPGLDLEITAVTPNPENGAVTIDFTAQYGNGTPVTAIADLQRAGAILAWPASEYQNAKSETISATSAGLVSATSVTGAYTYTFTAKLPVGSTDTIAVAMTGRVAFEYDGVARQQGLKSNSLLFFTLDGSAPVPRRSIVDEARCNKCHGEIRAHGEQRVGVDQCVMCHNPSSTDASRRPADQMPPATVNFKDMLHRVHTGEELSQPYTVYGFGGTAYDFTEILFPGLRNKCSICHGTNSVNLPLAAEALPTVVMQGTDLVSTILPERASCTTCHDSLMVDIHAILNSDAASGVETCAICHGAGADFSVSGVHAMTP
jgi:OmcA/MtrC family decaheme c-type cytochrome